MQHLAVRAELSEDRKTCKIRITEQTHRGREFGDRGTFKHGNIKLKSFGFPNYEGREGNFHLVYLRGTNERQDCTPLEVPATLWPNIKAAVAAYNERYAEKPVRSYSRSSTSNYVIQSRIDWNLPILTTGDAFWDEFI